MSPSGQPSTSPPAKAGGRKRRIRKRPKAADKTRRVWKNLFVKYANNEHGQYVYILKTDYRKADMNFKFPLEHLPGVISWMTNLLENTKQPSGSKYWQYTGPVINKLDLKSTTCSFVGDHLKVGTLHLHPCLPSFWNLRFRIWNEPKEEFIDVFKDDRPHVYHNPREYVTFLGIRQFKGLLRSLQEINSLVNTS